MRRPLLATLSLALLPVAAAPAPAAAAPTGVVCAYTAVHDTVVPGPAWTGAVAAGPMLATGLPGLADPAAEIQLHCAIQVAAADTLTHAAPDAAIADSAATPAVAVLPPAPVSFVVPPEHGVFVCTAATVAGVPYYLDSAAGVWSSTPDVPCDGPFYCVCPAEEGIEVRVTDEDGDGEDEAVVDVADWARLVTVDLDLDGDDDAICGCLLYTYLEDTDGDGDEELVVTPFGLMPPVDLDGDGDPDVVNGR